MAGRNLKPLDSDLPPARAALAAGLREMVGDIPFREVARRSGRGVSTISRVFAGLDMTTWDVLRVIVCACGGDQARIMELWHQAATESAGTVRPQFTPRLETLERIVWELTERLEKLEGQRST